MKFFTKRWFNIMQIIDCSIGMKSIADKKYTDKDISALYDKKLKAEISRDRREYNEPPHGIDIDFDNAELDDFAFFDVETNTLTRPASIEEVKREYEEEQARLDEEFANRPPFDPQETIERFENIYKARLRNGYLYFPDWVKDELVKDKVDVRLIALDYLPKSTFDRIKTEQRKNKVECDKIEREAKKVLGNESKKIPERILSEFGFHDGMVLSLEQIRSELVMTIQKDGVSFDEQTPYAKVIFTNGKIIERDENLMFENCIWLYDELYKTMNGYEVHMLFMENELRYLTISCDDIVIEHNIQF